MPDKPEDISSTSNIQPNKGIQGSEEHRISPGQPSFQSYMEEGGQAPQKAGGETQQISPFDLAAQSAARQQGGPPTMESVLGQMRSTSSVLGDLQEQLGRKNLKLKPSKKYLMRNKLTSANKTIREAARAGGLDPGATPNLTAKQNPVTRFLTLVGDSQNQLGNVQSMISDLHAQGGTLSPGLMLEIQTKLAKAQQELEFSSVLLSSAVSDIKQMFNIQV